MAEENPFGVAVNKSRIVKLLQQLSSDKCNNGKVFFSSYPVKWEALNVSQRVKTIQFWNTNIAENVRLDLIREANNLDAQDDDEEEDRQLRTSKDDLVI